MAKPNKTKRQRIERLNNEAKARAADVANARRDKQVVASQKKKKAEQKKRAEEKKS